jgi:hypothetical protein
MRSRIKRRGAVATAAAIASLGLAAGQAPAALPGLTGPPPAQQVNDDPVAGIDGDRDAGLSDVVVGGWLVAGGLRVPWGAAHDQGLAAERLAHRHAPTDVTTGDASSVTLSSAHVSGSVNPAGAAVRAHFDYGTTTGYGSRTASRRLRVATTPVTFGVVLSALPEYTAIHYRSVVDSGLRTLHGPDRVLVTGSRVI